MDGEQLGHAGATTPSLNDVLDRLEARPLGILPVADARLALEAERAGR